MRIKVALVCSNLDRARKSQHGRLTIKNFVVDDAGTVTEQKHRTKAFPGGVTDQGERVHNRAFVPDPSIRADHAGSELYRIKCPKCGLDRTVPVAMLNRLILETASLGRMSFDVSVLRFR